MKPTTNDIRKIRLMREISGQRLASAVGISQGYLSDIETGKKWPSAHLAFQIANVLGVSIFDLGLKPPRTTPTTQTTRTAATKRTNFLEGRRMPDNDLNNDHLYEEFATGPMLYIPARPSVSEILAARRTMRADIVKALQTSLQSGALEIPVCEDQDILLTAYESAMQEARNLLVLLTIARNECRRADENLQGVRAALKEIGERQAKSAAIEAENVNLKIEKFIGAVAENVKKATTMDYEGASPDGSATFHVTLKKSFNVILLDTFLEMFGPKEVAPLETVNLFPEDEPCVQ